MSENNIFKIGSKNFKIKLPTFAECDELKEKYNYDILQGKMTNEQSLFDDLKNLSRIISFQITEVKEVTGKDDNIQDLYNDESRSEIAEYIYKYGDMIIFKKIMNFFTESLKGQ
jgi:hypothetical protein